MRAKRAPERGQARKSLGPTLAGALGAQIHAGVEQIGLACSESRSCWSRGTVSGQLTNDHLRALGRIAANATVLETHLHFVTWGLISPDQSLGQIITGGMNFDRLRELFRS